MRHSNLHSTLYEYAQKWHLSKIMHQIKGQMRGEVLRRMEKYQHVGCSMAYLLDAPSVHITCSKQLVATQDTDTI